MSTLPAKPFTARSLVGMTMGARKRAYRRAVEKLEQAPIWRGDVVLRAAFRIGQRLRPCLGCYLCCPMPCQGCGMLPSLDTDCEACRADHYMMAMYACDGSGVLPAKGPGPGPGPGPGTGTGRQKLRGLES